MLAEIVAESALCLKRLDLVSEFSLSRYDKPTALFVSPFLMSLEAFINAFHVPSSQASEWDVPLEAYCREQRQAPRQACHLGEGRGLQWANLDFGLCGFITWQL